MKNMLFFLAAMLVMGGAASAQTKPKGVSAGILGGIAGYGFIGDGSRAGTLYAGGGITVDGKILKHFGVRMDVLAGGDISSGVSDVTYSSQIFHYADVSLGIAPYYEWNFSRFHLDLGEIVNARVRIPKNDTGSISKYVMTVACSTGPYICFKYDITDHLQISAHHSLCVMVYDYNASLSLSGYSNRVAGSSSLYVGCTWQF